VKGLGSEPVFENFGVPWQTFGFFVGTFGWR
jgi:hypothetical protein